MLENTTKIRNYAGGEIHQTADGYYIFVKDDSHAGPYVSIASLKGAIQPTTDTTDEAAGGEAVVLDGATEEELLAEGVSQEDIDQAVADGTEVEPTTDTTDEVADGEAAEAGDK